MDIRKVEGTGSGEENKRFFASFHHDWEGIFSLGKGFNWVNFTFIKAQCEITKYTGAVEFEFGLLGFNLILTYTYDMKARNALRDEVDWIMDDLKNSSHTT